jgi:hypothetical protein
MQCFVKVPILQNQVLTPIKPALKLEAKMFPADGSENPGYDPYNSLWWHLEKWDALQLKEWLTVDELIDLSRITRKRQALTA